MIKKCLILFQFTFISISGQSSFHSKSFQVSKSDLETNVYTKDSTANALVIYEEGYSYFSKETRNLTTQIKRKIKILNKSKEKVSLIEIPLYISNKKNEQVKNVLATTHNLIEGKIVSHQLKEKDIFEEAISKDHNVVKFILPNIQESSVITYSYTIESPFIYKFYGWEFQSDIPKLYSVYNTSIPVNFEYHIKLLGYKDLDNHTSEIEEHCYPQGSIMGINILTSCLKTSYSMSNIPAFIEENFMTSKYNFLSRIDFELNSIKNVDGTGDDFSKTWKDVDKELKLDPDVGKQILKTSLVKDILPKNIITISNQLKKAQAIFNFVQKNYTWNGQYQILNNVSVKNLIKNKSGKVSEINILLHNMLKENGLQVKPVLLSTRENGFATKLYPVITDFNYLIIQLIIDEKSYLLDGTDKYLTFGEIPFKCLNKYGRLIDFKKGSEWIDIKAKNSSVTQHHFNLKINDNESITGIINSRYSGYHALSKKKKYFSDPSIYLENFKNKNLDIEVLSYKLKTKEKNSAFFQESFDIKHNNLNIIGNQKYFDPFIFKFFKENPFKLKDRDYPIDFGFKDSFSYNLQLDLGNQYELVNIPNEVNIGLPNNLGSFIFKTTVIGNKLSIILKINFKKEIYEPEYYEALKSFINQIVDVQTKTLIVLKKK